MSQSESLAYGLVPVEIPDVRIVDSEVNGAQKMKTIQRFRDESPRLPRDLCHSAK